jgi:acyl carrier protein
MNVVNTIARSEPMADAENLADFLIAFITARAKLPVGMVVTETTPLTDLGLDSLSLLRLSGELEDALSLPIEPALLFDTATVGDLAAELQALRASVASGG